MSVPSALAAPTMARPACARTMARTTTPPSWSTPMGLAPDITQAIPRWAAAARFDGREAPRALTSAACLAQSEDRARPLLEPDPNSKIERTIKPGEGSDFVGTIRGIPTDPVSGTAVLEYGPTEILPPVAAVSKQPARLCRPSRQASRAHPRGKPGFSTYESGLRRETDSPLEQAGFEPSVPGTTPTC
jgi:hypothetical protein